MTPAEWLEWRMERVIQLRKEIDALHNQWARMYDGASRSELDATMRRIKDAERELAELES
jgi:hypothetical protein